jgi:hypothetical protein
MIKKLAIGTLAVRSTTVALALPKPPYTHSVWAFSDDDTTTHVDDRSIEHFGPIVKMMLSVNYRTPQYLEQSKVIATSFSMMVAVNCKTRMVADGEMTFFDAADK